MRMLAVAAVLTAITLTVPAEAQRVTLLQARTAGELADLCAANPKEPLGDAKINFCHGFAQGAIDVELHHAGATKPFCFPHPGPSRTETMHQFVDWVRAVPDRGSMPSTEGLFRFLAERFPCK